MSDHDNPLISRLAVQRLAMPGVIDRTPMQRKCEQLEQPAAKHELTARLQRRALPGDAVTDGSLVWRRVPERAEVVAEAVPVMSSSVSSSGPTTTTMVQRAALPAAESSQLVQRLASRAHTPGMLATGAASLAAREGGSRFEMGSTRPEPGSSSAANFAATLQARYGVAPAASSSPTVSVAPVLSISRAPTGVIRRQADPAAATQLMRSETGTASVVAVPITSRESAPHFNPLGPVPAYAGMTGFGPLRRDDGSRSAAVNKFVTPMSIGAQGVSRQRLIDSPSTPPLVPSAAPSTGSDSPLVLRRMMAPPVQASVPGAIPPTTVALPQVETPAMPEPAAMPTPEMRAAQPGADLERIVEEVGRRLLRRLEIERERKGIRQWR